MVIAVNMKKQLANLSELRSNRWQQVMRVVNDLARTRYVDLQEYTTYSRVWEYPWVWFQLESLKGNGLRVLDIGSERSPFPWFLATQGFDVVVSDISPNYWRVWQRASRQLDVSVRKHIVNAQELDLRTASVDVYLSVSVIEHVPDKAKVIAEAARVLRPGGLLVMTFDVCEPDIGMSFPEWNGWALTMREFDDLFQNSPWFESGLAGLSWNANDIPDYLAWNRTTAPWHNYVTGAATVYRSNKAWVEPKWKDHSRILKGKLYSIYVVAIWYLWHSWRVVRLKVARLVRRSSRFRT